MESAYDQEKSLLRLEFDSAEAISAFIESAQRESGFLVTLPTRLKLHQPVAIELAAGAEISSASAHVGQVFDKGFGRYGTAFLVEGWSEAPPATDSAAAAEPGKPEVEATVEGDDDPEPEEDPGEMRGVSPIHAIKSMNPRQRAMLAMKASRTQRKILLRDNSPQVLQNLLANPYIDSEEVLQIARSSHVVAPILQRIATDSRWNANQEILAIIARHPKTPTLFATRLMPALRTSDLRMMAKMSSGLREMTRKAALREYMRRTGQKI